MEHTRYLSPLRLKLIGALAAVTSIVMAGNVGNARTELTAIADSVVSRLLPDTTPNCDATGNATPITVYIAGEGQNSFTAIAALADGPDNTQDRRKLGQEIAEANGLDYNAPLHAGDRITAPAHGAC